MKQKNTESTAKKAVPPKKRTTKPKTSSATTSSTTKSKTSSATKTKRTTKKTVNEVSAPEYQAPTFEAKEKPLSFSRLIANETIIKALEKSDYSVPSKDMFAILPPVLRGSDTMVYKTKQTEDFLISSLSALMHTLDLSSPDNEEQPKQLVNVSFFPTLELAEAANNLIVQTFEGFRFKCSTNSDEHNINLLLTTPEAFLKAHNNTPFDLKTIKCLCFYELDQLEKHQESLRNVLSLFHKTQRVFVAHENTPKSRELAFEYLENSEILQLLPNTITEQQPRQFSHALESTKKFQVLLGYLKTHKPRCALVVANTRTVAEWIAYKLHGNSIKVALLASPLSLQSKREEFLSKVSSGETRVVVTTDYCLKNFGLENLHCIYHFDLPENPNDYIERLRKFEGARTPISIAFICEDYGFNMGKIEDLLGFKIKLTRPDKNYFHFKDESDYPLHNDGRVKAIGEKPVEVEQPAQTTQAPQPTQASEAQPISTKTVEEKSKPTPEKQKPATKHYQPDTSKFVRRDERAREAVADAVFAAKQAEEKKKTAGYTKKTTTHTQKTQPSNISVFAAVVSVVVDSLKAGINATKDSFVHNAEEKLPKLHKWFKRSKK